MNEKELRIILTQHEAPNLEFKRKFYEIYHPEFNIKAYQRDELIRDIVALANNDTTTAGEISVLIIGADDKITDGYRKIHGCNGRIPSSRELLDIINPAIDPPLTNLTTELVEIEEGKLFVISIMPDPYIHETRRQLKTGDKTFFSEHVVFIRHNDSIRIASSKERSAIQELRRIRFTEGKVPLAFFGALIGGSIGGSLSVRLIEANRPIEKYNKLVAGIVGALVFGGLGAAIGNTFRAIVEIRADWHKFNPTQKASSLLFMAVFPISLIFMFFGKPIQKSGNEKMIA